MDLAEVCEINPKLNERLGDDEIVSFLGMADVSEAGTTTVGVDRPYTEVRKGYTSFRDSDVLLAKITPCFENGKIAQARLARAQGFGSTEFHVLRGNQDVLDQRYLLHFLRRMPVRVDGERRMTGSGGQRRVPVNFLQSLQIPLPPLPEQRRIAAILDHADALRVKRRASVVAIESLCRAVFRESFGPMEPGKFRWPTVRVDDIGDVQLGRQRAPKYQTGNHTRPYMRVANVYEDRIDTTDTLSMDFDSNDFRRYRLHYGDILLNEGQSTELVGRPAMWRNEIDNCCFQNTLLRFRVDPEKCSPEFALAVFLEYLRNGQFARTSSKTSSVAHLGAARFAAMRFPLVPREEQHRYTDLHHELGVLKSESEVSLSALDCLFASLQSRAFRGEL